MSGRSDDVTIVAWSEDDALPIRGLARPAQRRSVIRRITRGVLFGLLLTGIAAGIAAPLWLWKTGRLQSMGETLRHRFVTESAAYGLAVDQVLLIGRVLAPKEALARAIDVDRGTPILS
ncbi:MAG: hypothetical protein WD270_07220, partial [Acetobacterales bacterium]